jgi:hypothetical protein
MASATPARRRVPTVRAVLLAGAAVIALVVIVGASLRDYRLLGSNRVPAAAFALRLGPGQSACQRATIPAGTGAVRVLALGAGRPTLALTVDGHFVTGARTGGDGWGTLRIPPPATTRTLATLCLRAAGSGPVTLAGQTRPAGANARDGQGRVLRAAARLEFTTAHPASWWSRLGDIFRRFGEGKPGWVGGWTLVLAALLLAGGLAAAGWALLRAGEDAG